MSFWDRTRAALGFSSPAPRKPEVAFEDDRVVLRDLQSARAIPQEPGESGGAEMSNCQRCAKPVRKVVFTTAGSGAQVALWQEYPLAVDGWVCAACGWAAVPRFISADESVEFGRAAAAHATEGRFDDAEFWFRRIIASWPGYAPGYADLGRLLEARADATKNAKAKLRYRSDAASWLRRAVSADPELCIVHCRISLARMLALTGTEDEALALLHSLRDHAALETALREEASALADDIRAGKALFSRATELMGTLPLEHVSKPLQPKDREVLEDGLALLRQTYERHVSFATCFIIGKVEFRLGRLDAALAALEEAHSVEPDHPDGCRELALVYLQLGRSGDALRISRRAFELRPADPGLRCNLALALLLTGDLDGARAEASAALAADPSDTITGALVRKIDDVIAGRRPRPRSLAELEGRGAS